MFRTAVSMAVIAVVCWVAIRLIFGFAGGIVGMLLSLAWLALKLVLVVGLVYWVISVFSPETARKMRDVMKGESL